MNEYIERMNSLGSIWFALVLDFPYLSESPGFLYLYSKLNSKCKYT